MEQQQRLKNLSYPQRPIDVVLDTDAYNEVDDQFAIAYLFSVKEKLNTKVIYAAPFFNKKSESPADGMEKSYHEIFKVLDLAGEQAQVLRGSDRYLENEQTPVISDAAKDLAERVKDYSPENPLYVVALGAITNIASAILLNPQVAENAVVVWLGGHAHHYHDTAEFNMRQDIAAARVVFTSGVPLIQLPCWGVVGNFAVSELELKHYFMGKNPLADYLARNAIEEAETYANGTAWGRVIWDVTAVAWLLNDEDQFMRSRIIPGMMPNYDNQYEPVPQGYPIRYVYHIKRDKLLNALIRGLT